MARTSATNRKNTSTGLAPKSPAAMAPMTTVSGKSPASATKTSLDETDRHQMIKVAAYYLAEQRGFSGGDPVSDWLAAEARIDAMLKKAGVTRVH
ncbi:MAG TPA: DUF2934 domain-containing protein [Gallionella sp.]|nr:DUF2934 domain-containing protein [Gallionella sp.]